MYICIKDSEVDSKWEAKGDVGIWVGRDRNSKGHWVVPIGEYDSESETYTLYRPISVTTVKVYDNDFILCKKPSKNTIIEEDPHYNSFIDKFNPTTDDSVEDDGDHNNNLEVVDDDDELEPDEDGKYEVKAIIGDKHVIERTSKGRIIKRG